MVITRFVQQGLLFTALLLVLTLSYQLGFGPEMFAWSDEPRTAVLVIVGCAVVGSLVMELTSRLRTSLLGHAISDFLAMLAVLLVMSALAPQMPFPADAGEWAVVVGIAVVYGGLIAYGVTEGSVVDEARRARIDASPDHEPSSMRGAESLPRRMVRVAGWGAALGALLAAIPVLELLVRGLDVPALAVVMVPLAGIVGGVLGGLHRPVMHDGRSAMVAGAITGLVLAGALETFGRWLEFGASSAVIGQLLLGAVLGPILARWWWKTMR